MFKKILIANRGEIACRVIKTAHRLGIKTVAVYSDADQDALHVRMANEAVAIGPAPAAQSYLVIENIIQACQDTGAEAVHPGYGFLSENAAFANALAAAGITFIGPPVKAIEAMGDKITSKRIAADAGVNTIPGYSEIIQDADQAVVIARDIGYPVMLKASAGGGGKGMRVAWNDAECRDGFERATNEARSSFGDDRVFVEKFIEQPRHIEIQVMADQHGNTIYLGERECSIQRRHQKVIEEAPSPFLDEATRQAMGKQAVALAKAVDYCSAGTVEFVVDKERNFYFLEMNTRLQVEHPVTELVTGLDLVELMINVAAGEPLPLQQSDVQLDGWAVESRIYAEDPVRSFLPSVGRLIHYQPPAEDNHVRVDTGVVAGSEISMFYDPMIAKLVTWQQDRESALACMRTALDEFHIRGVATNTAFLSSLVQHPRFITGDFSTNFIAEEYPDGFQALPLDESSLPLIIASATYIHTRYANRNATINQQLNHQAYQLGKQWVIVINKQYHPVAISTTDDDIIIWQDNPLTVKTDWVLSDPLFKASINGSSICIQIDRKGISYRLQYAGIDATALVLTPQAAEYQRLMPVKLPPDMSKFLLSPMPGLLVQTMVSEGDQVEAGQPLVVIEAMKMENVLRAEQNGKIAKLLAAERDSLAVDQPIIEFE